MLKLKIPVMKMLPALILIFATLLISCRNENTAMQQENETVYVKGGMVYEEYISFPVKSSGRLSLKSEQKLGFRTGGIIRSIDVQSGQTVKKGQLIAALNLSEIEAQVNIAAEAYEKAKRDYLRAENLYKDSVATLELYQDAKTALEIGESNLEVAKFNLKYSKIEAPSDGKILKILMEENEMTSPGYPVVLFGSTTEKWVVRASVSDKDMISIQIGDSAKITFDPYPESVFPGKVSEIAGMADPYTGTYEVEISLLNTLKKQMAAGLIARIEIIPARTVRLCKVPADALFNSSENIGYVYQVTDSGAIRKKVKIEHVSDEFIYVTGALQSGALVLTEGYNYINEKTKIELDTTPHFK